MVKKKMSTQKLSTVIVHTVVKDVIHVTVFSTFVCFGSFFLYTKVKRIMADIVNDEPRKAMDIDIEHEDGSTTNWIEEDNKKQKKKIVVRKKKTDKTAQPSQPTLEEMAQIERDLSPPPKKAQTSQTKVTQPSIDEQFYALNLKLQQFASMHPEQCKYTKEELIAMRCTKKNLTALSFAYQSYCLADNTAFTQLLGQTALGISAYPVGKIFSCEDELTEELNNDVMLNQKLQDLAFSGISRNELPPAMVIATLYARDLVKAKHKASQKRANENPLDNQTLPPKLE